MSQYKSAESILTVLDLILRHTVHGLTNNDIVRATGISATNVSRYVAVLEKSGWAEKIPETGRTRASNRVAQLAVGVMRDIDRAQSRLAEMHQRITTDI